MGLQHVGIHGRILMKQDRVRLEKGGPQEESNQCTMRWLRGAVIPAGLG